MICPRLDEAHQIRHGPSTLSAYDIAGTFLAEWQECAK